MQYVSPFYYSCKIKLAAKIHLILLTRNDIQFSNELACLDENIKKV